MFVRVCVFLGNTAFDEDHVQQLEGWIDTLDSVSPSNRENKLLVWSEMKVC